MKTEYIFLFFLLVIALYWSLQKKKTMLHRILGIKRKRGKKIMPEIIESFVGKDCLIYLGSGGTADGVIKQVSGNWISLVGPDGKISAVNIDYISRIREYPMNKKGKRAIVIE